MRKNESDLDFRALLPFGMIFFVLNFRYCGPSLHVFFFFWHQYANSVPISLVWNKPHLDLRLTIITMSIKTTVIGAWPKPSYLKIKDWFQNMGKKL